MTNLSRRRYLAIKIEQTFVLFNEGYTSNKMIFSMFVEFDDSERCHATDNFEITFYTKSYSTYDELCTTIDEYI